MLGVASPRPSRREGCKAKFGGKNQLEEGPFQRLFPKSSKRRNAIEKAKKEKPVAKVKKTTSKVKNVKEVEEVKREAKTGTKVSKTTEKKPKFPQRVVSTTLPFEKLVQVAFLEPKQKKQGRRYPGPIFWFN